MPKRTEKIEVRVTEDEKKFIQGAADLKDLSVSDFVRFVSVEMARAIATGKSPEEIYYAVVMGAGKVSPEVVLYATPSPSPSPGPPDYMFEDEDEDET